jgi:hypothetical protein
MARTETMTVRLSPETRWALEVLSRIDGQSVTATAACAIENHILARIEELKVTSPDDAKVLENALKQKAPKPFSRVIALAETGPDIMNLSELRTLSLLEDLGAITPKDDAPGFDFDPVLLRAIWRRFTAAAETDDIDVDVLVELKAYVAEAKSRLEPT